MNLFLLLIICIGICLLLVGMILTIVRAFQQGVGWGLAVLLLPLAQLVFTVVHWPAARTGFFATLAGLVLVVFAAALGEPSGFGSERPGWAGALEQAAKAPSGSVQGLTEQIDRLRNEIVEVEESVASRTQAMTAEYNGLAAKRAGLKAGDTAAVEAFNSAAAEYTARKESLAAERTGLQQRQDRLSALLSKRSAAAPAPPAPPVPPMQAPMSGASVVMYSTRTCPACRSAKSYLAQKGIPYIEKDVETSPQAADEFRQMNGRGVPLLLIKGRRIDGFSARQIDAALAGT